MATIAITGASRGIGLELARQYAAAGDQVLAFCRSPQKADALNRLAAETGKVRVIEMDVADEASVKRAAAQAGDAPVDVLLNVAGISGPEGNELESSDWSAWAETFNVMTMGPLRVLQAFLPHMRPGAKVINLTSQVGASTWPYRGYYAYSAAKAGLNRLMRAVAMDLRSRHHRRVGASRLGADRNGRRQRRHHPAGKRRGHSRGDRRVDARTLGRIPQMERGDPSLVSAGVNAGSAAFP